MFKQKESFILRGPGESDISKELKKKEKKRLKEAKKREKELRKRGLAAVKKQAPVESKDQLSKPVTKTPEKNTKSDHIVEDILKHPAKTPIPWMIPLAILFLLVLIQFKVFDYSANFPHVTETYSDFINGDCQMQTDEGVVSCKDDFARRGIDLNNVNAAMKEYYNNFFIKTFVDKTKLFDLFTFLLLIPFILFAVLLFMRRSMSRTKMIVSKVLKITGYILASLALLVLVGSLVAVSYVFGTYSIIGFGTMFLTVLSLMSSFVVQLVIGIVFVIAARFIGKQRMNSGNDSEQQKQPPVQQQPVQNKQPELKKTEPEPINKKDDASFEKIPFVF